MCQRTTLVHELSQELFFLSGSRKQLCHRFAWYLQSEDDMRATNILTPNILLFTQNLRVAYLLPNTGHQRNMSLIGGDLNQACKNNTMQRNNLRMTHTRVGNTELQRGCRVQQSAVVRVSNSASRTRKKTSILHQFSRWLFVCR